MELKTAYLLLGEEKLLQEKYLQKIKISCFPDPNSGELEFNYVSLDGQTTTSQKTVNEALQLPFIAQKRVIVVKNAKGIIDEQLIEYLKNPSPATCLILLVDKIDKRLHIYKALRQCIEIIECDRLRDKDIIEWIKEYLKQNGDIQISYNDLVSLINSLNNNLTGIKQELDKLITFIGKRRIIKAEDIQFLVVENKLRSSFDLTNAIQAQDTATAIILVNNLVNQGKNIPDIIGLLRWMLLRLWQGKEIFTNKGKGAISTELRMPPYFVNRFIEQIQNFSTEELKKGLVKLFNTEKILRTYTLPKKLLLEMLIFDLTNPS